MNHQDARDFVDENTALIPKNEHTDESSSSFFLKVVDNSIGSFTFFIATTIACGVALLAMILTFVKSTLKPLFPTYKVLDVGLFVTFGSFALVAHFGPGLSQFISIWANAVMNYALALIAGVGIYINEPFIKPLAIEMGLPAFLAVQPLMIVILNEMTMIWLYGFLAMGAVSSVAPLYQCLYIGAEKQTDNMYWWLNVIFTYGAQYAIVAGLVLKGMWDGYQEKKIWPWIERSPEMYINTHGDPVPDTIWYNRTKRQIVVDSGMAQDEAKAGHIIIPITSLPDDRVDPHAQETVEKAGNVLAHAFVNDPLYLSWPGYGELEDINQRQIEMAKQYTSIATLCRRFRHSFNINDGAAYCLCMPCWPDSNEFTRAMSTPAMKGFGVAEAMVSPTGMLPPVEIYHVSKMTSKAIRGRPHLYVYILGCSPEEQKQGYGAAAMALVCYLADLKGVPVALETTKAVNVTFYKQFGFQVVGSLQVKNCQDPWVAMVREPPVL